MKVRYKITAAFLVLALILLAAVCGMIYYSTAQQQQKDFYLRLENRAITVSSLLSRLPENGYALLSRLDSATANLLVAENILVFRNENELLYRFDRIASDTIAVSPSLLADAVEAGEARSEWMGKRMYARYFSNGSAPIIVVTAARDENANNNLRDLRRNMIAALVTGILLSLIAGWWFSRRLLRPLDHISQTVNTISATNIQERLPQDGDKDEWNRLSHTFNSLLQRLQDSFELQGRFISNASHEMSTPLTVIINQIDVTLQNDRPKHEYLQTLDSVRSEVLHMAELTQQLLTLARTSRGGILLTEEVRVDEVLMDIPALVTGLSEEYQVRVHFDELPEEERSGMVEGNRELLISAFRNIAENGCKYAPDHTVSVSLSFVADKIVVLFSNKYTYLETNELERIFQPFERGSNVTDEPGYGLGLSLTRRIVLLHKGEISASIVEPDKLVIAVTLPSVQQFHHP